MTTPRLLFMHAHPDDESSKGAATAARYVDEGAEVVLVTCTGGEAGSVLNPSADAVGAQDMGEVRARELEAAVAAIGFTRTHQLGYVDSGYHENPADVPEGTFARVPLDEASARVAGVLRAERPHVVVTYPEDGGYPHPDHIMTYLVTMRGLELAADPDADLSGVPGGERSPWQPAKVYASMIFPPERMQALHEAALAHGIESPYTEWLEERAKRSTAPNPDTRVRCGDWFERRDAALLAHVTQIDPDGFWFTLPRDIEREAYPYEGYLLMSSLVTVRPQEDDLFAGVDLEAWDRAYTESAPTPVAAGTGATGGSSSDAR